MTCEWRCREPLVARASKEERKGRLPVQVLYNDLDTWHSGYGVILLVGLRRYDPDLSVTFKSNMQLTPNSVVMFVSYGHLPLYYKFGFLATSLLVLLFTVVFEGLWRTLK